jgi:sugar phosphate permease
MSPDSQVSETVDAQQPVRLPYRWVVLGIAFLAFLITFVDRLAWANVGLLASKSIGVPLAALGAFVTAFYSGYVIANILGGVLTDRLGPRRTLALALFPLALTTFAFGYTTFFAEGLLLQALMGFFAGADYAAGIKIISSWFPSSERGRALGLYATAPSVGVAFANGVYPTALLKMEWQNLYFVLGLATAVVGLICLLGLRDAPIQTRNSNSKPSLRLVFGNRTLMVIALAGFGANWGTWGFAFWATALMVRGHHLTPVAAGTVTMIFGAVAIISKPVFGLISDLMGGRRRPIIIADLFAFAATLMLFGWQDSELWFLIVAPLLGTTAFVYSPLLAAMITEVAEPRTIGAATGTINAFWQLGSVLVPSVVGLVFASTDSFQAAFVVLAAGPLLGALCMLLPVSPGKSEQEIVTAPAR